MYETKNSHAQQSYYQLCCETIMILSGTLSFMLWQRSSESVLRVPLISCYVRITIKLSTKTFCHLQESGQFGGGPVCPKQLLIHYKEQAYTSVAVSVMCSRLINSCLPSDNPSPKIRARLLNLLQPAVHLSCCVEIILYSNTPKTNGHFWVSEFLFDETINTVHYMTPEFLKPKYTSDIQLHLSA